MKKTVPITIVILTYNEEKNIRQALDNVTLWASDVLVLDSGSTDNTLSIIEDYESVSVFHRDFDDYANQRNYAITDLPHTKEWMFFLDADEYLTDELKDELEDIVVNGSDKDGYYVKWKFIFFDKWIKYGGYYPTWILRFFRVNKGKVNRGINEHISIDGETDYLKHDFIHKDHKSFREWLDKHNKYSTFEADELFKTQKTLNDEEKEFAKFFGSQAQRKRWLREKIWKKFVPPLVRPFVYFFYAYILRFGFLDGKVGFMYHFMHGLVFYFIVDIKYLEKKLKMKHDS